MTDDSTADTSATSLFVVGSSARQVIQERMGEGMIWFPTYVAGQLTNEPISFETFLFLIQSASTQGQIEQALFCLKWVRRKGPQHPGLRTIQVELRARLRPIVEKRKNRGIDNIPPAPPGNGPFGGHF